ncbi:tyrosine-type recombinase/integrase [Robbsia andropogonis]|nr:tyrosine-type recombinase/integrase [Robbsia andropogonis]MCP1118879.1 tyrosine-type recombinase/integrase [Robbsia andropogonis]MCP1128346.1 tyrosine-type recombinase/integrase [Robbsia andropogonis]
MAARRRIASRRHWPANLYKNSRGYFYFRNPVTGKTFGLGTDMQNAIEQVNAVNADMAARKPAMTLLSRVNSQEKTLRMWCDDYLASFRDAKLSYGARWSLDNEVGTIRDSEEAAKPITKIEPKDVVAIVRRAELRGPSVAKKIRARAISIFRGAINEGLIAPGANPADSTYAPQSKVTRQRLTFDQFKDVLAQARAARGFEWAANSFLLALLTAQRREDIANMQFSQVRDGFLWIEQEKTKTKVKIPLSIYLPDIDMTVEDIIKKCRGRVVSKYLVHHTLKRGTAIVGGNLSIGHLSNKFAEFRDQAGIPVAEGKTPSSFHEIRSLSARLYTAAYGKEFAQAILGHRTARMTDLYRDSRGAEWMEVKIAS